MSDDRDPIDASLQRLFAVPELGGLQARVQSAARASQRASRSRRRMQWIVALAGAAAAAIVVRLVAVRSDAVVGPEDGPKVVSVDDARTSAGRQVAELYARAPMLPRVDDDGCMQAPPPMDACTSGDVEPRLRPGEGLELIGECGAPGQASCVDTFAARLVHLRWEGTDVLVWIERREHDPQPVLPAGSGLGVFRRELGTHVLYEITPLGEPHALAAFDR